MKVTVNVLAEDIVDGEKFACQSCPIALALKRALPGKGIVVGRIRAFMHPHPLDENPLAPNPYEAVAALPPVAEKFINTFDSGTGAEPITFDLEFTPRVK